MNWTCDETRRHLLRQDELSEEALEHLTQCAVCQEMMELSTITDLDSISNDAAIDVANLLSHTRLELSREQGLLAWLRSRSTPLRLCLGVGVALLPAMAQLVFARRYDLSDYPLPRLFLVVATYLVIVAFSSNTLLSPLYRPQSPTALRSAVGLAFIVPFVFAAMAPAHVPATVVPVPADVHHALLYQAWICLRYGTLLSLPAVLLFVAMDRQLARGRFFLTLTACTGGIAGNFVLLLHCSNEQPAHQLLGHATVGLALLAGTGTVAMLARKRPRNASRGSD